MRDGRKQACRIMGWQVEVLFEDADLVAVNKPSGLLSEGGGKRELDLEQLVSELVGRSALCCHRLDRLTSGVVLMRKNARLRAELSRIFETHRIRKEYWALVDGVWDKSIQKVESRIGAVGGGVWANVESGGKEAVSTFHVLGVDREKGATWLRALLKTGRTHQLRLHTLKAGCPLTGDPVYGKGREDGFFGLHARSLALRHPGSGESLDLVAEPPTAWKEWLARMA